MNVTAQAGDTLFIGSGASPLSTQDQKRVLRRCLRLQRQSVSKSARRRAARAIARLALRSPALRRARRVAIYLAMGSEVDTVPLIRALQARGVKLFAPCVVGSALRFRPLGRAALRRHPLGMREPRGGRSLPTSQCDVVVLPLLGFDSRGTRIGQGGGYYDRTLAHCRYRPYRLGLGFALQAIPLLPREAWDQPLHAVVTERGLIRFSRPLSGAARCVIG